MGTPSTPIQITTDPNPNAAVWARFVAPFLDGQEGLMRRLSVRGVKRLQDLVPVGANIRLVDGDGQHLLYAETSGWSVLAQGTESFAHVYVRAPSQELLEKGVADVKSRAPEPPVEEDKVVLDFWQVGQHGPFTTTRSIEAPMWEDIATHYPGEVRTQLEELHAAELAVDSGRIVLWHGPPGTGKTTAIRGLARSWQPKRRLQILLDPDMIFAASSTLMAVVLDDEVGEDVWRILVIEDADELLRHDAKDRVGQALSRLLNLGDGIMGQGLKVVVLITTNEPVRRLHPALVRPGRCLAEVEFRPFTAAEAKESLGVEREGTLAELMHGVEHAAPAVTGLYL